MPVSDSQTISHDFEVVSYTRPTYCDYCDKFLWGLSRQGLQCQSKYNNGNRNSSKETNIL